MIKHYCDRCSNEMVIKERTVPHITIFHHEGLYTDFELCRDCEKEIMDFLKLGADIVLSARKN